MAGMRKLLTIAHSYVVALNRRLAHEMARAGTGRWEVTAVSPTYFRGDLRPVPLEPLGSEPCHLTAVPVYWTNRVHLFLYSWALRSLLRSGWDLVHCWEEPYILAGSQVAWWTPSRISLVYSTYQNLVKSYPPPFRWTERYCMKRASGWIAGGRTIVDSLGSRPGYRDRPVQIISMGVDTVHFAPDRALGLATRRSLSWCEPGPPVVGFLGRFVPEKGVELLVRVLEGLKTPWRALFVGGGPLEGSLRSWASRRPEQVRVCTGVTHDAVPCYLNAMDILCAPSQTRPGWREQFGRMLVEGFACGVPVVGSDSGEIPYSLGESGLVVGESDEAGWSKTVADLLDSPRQRQHLATLGRERAVTHFAWPVIAAQHLDFFERILDQRRR